MPEPQASSMSERVYARVQASNPERPFNDDLIYFRDRDHVAEYLEDVFTALQVVDGIHFEGLEVETDESKFPPEVMSADVDMNRLDLITLHFRLVKTTMNKDGEEVKEEDEVSMPVFFPKLVDRFFFHLNSTLYYPIFQMVERGTYTTRESFTLKTLLMPLMFKTDTRIVLKDARDGEKYSPIVFVLDLFGRKPTKKGAKSRSKKSRINALLYMIAKHGFLGTLGFLGIDEESIVLAAPDEMDGYPEEEWTAFEVKIAKRSKIMVMARREWLGTDTGDFPWIITATLVDLISRYKPSIGIIEAESVLLDAMASGMGSVEINGVIRPAGEVAEEVEIYWLKRLGGEYTTTPATVVQKARRIQVSLERILDGRTRKNLVHVEDWEKEDIYCILRWMMREYKDLSQIDNMDMLTKRIRIAEYLIHPILIRFSQNTYRLLNSQNVTLKGLKSIFTSVKPDFVIEMLPTMDPIRYSSSVNQHDLFTVALRMTVQGPQSMGKQHLATRFRGHHESYIGRLGLSTSSASDPGVTGTLVPFAEMDGQFFV